MATGAYCPPDEAFFMANVVEDKDLTEAEMLIFIRLANDEIDGELAGYYDIPFATRTDPIGWEATDNIPPLIRTIATKFAAAYAIRKLFAARAGKNDSPYGDVLYREAKKMILRVQRGEKNLVDTDGNIMARVEAGSTNAATNQSVYSPTDPTQVMPDMYEEYPDFVEVPPDVSSD